MALYAVVEKLSGLEVYRYEADNPIEWNFMGFDTHDHNLQPAPPAPEVVINTNPTEWLLDIGAFFDRFGVVKFNILTSSDVLVKAIIQDVMVRKWVDLRRPDVAYGVSVLSTKIPELTSAMVTSILTTPVRPDENLALRIMYFNGE